MSILHQMRLSESEAKDLPTLFLRRKSLMLNSSIDIIVLSENKRDGKQQNQKILYERTLESKNIQTH